MAQAEAEPNTHAQIVELDEVRARCANRTRRIPIIVDDDLWSGLLAAARELVEIERRRRDR